VVQSFEKGTVLRAHFATIEELIGCKTRGQHRCEKALLDLLRSGLSAAAAVPRPTRRRETRMSRRMRASPRARRLARAFTLH
jgi:hypothetical protein